MVFKHVETCTPGALTSRPGSSYSKVHPEPTDFDDVVQAEVGINWRIRITHFLCLQITPFLVGACVEEEPFTQEVRVSEGGMGMT